MKKITLLLLFALIGTMPTWAKLTKIAPNSSKQGTTPTVKLYGTSFGYSSYTTITLKNHKGKLLPVSGLNVYGPDSVSFKITISKTADTGYYTVICKDSLFKTTDSLKSSFRVIGTVTPPPPPTAKILSISPNRGSQGNTVAVHVYGQNTSWVKDSSVSMYIQSGSTLNGTSLSVVSDTEITANLVISSTFRTGTYSVYVKGNIEGLLSESLAFTVDTTVRSLSGTITTSTGAACGSSWVYLVYLKTSDSTIHNSDSTMTDSMGHYSFTNLTSSSVHVYAWPDSAMYPKEIPTYYDSAVMFLDGSSVSLSLGANTLSFSTISGTNPGGTGFVGGSVYYCSICKKGGPVANIKVFLVDAKGVIQGYTMTDANGNFGFKNLSIQKYSFKVDMPKIDNSAAPSVTLTSSLPTQNKLKLTLYPTYLDMDAASVVTSIVNEVNIANTDASIYPNPFSSTLLVNYTLAKSAQVSINVLDITGKSVYSSIEGNQISGNHSRSINELAAMPSGLYLVQIHADGNLIQMKVMKY